MNEESEQHVFELSEATTGDSYNVNIQGDGQIVSKTVINSRLRKQIVNWRVLMMMSMSSNVSWDERKENKQVNACQMPQRVSGYVRQSTFTNISLLL